MKTLLERHIQGLAHCPMCTHTVPADIDLRGRSARGGRTEVPALRRIAGSSGSSTDSRGGLVRPRHW
jgi:hypothetical protein